MTSYRGRRLDGTLAELHQAVDLLDADTVPESYYLQVIANRVPMPPHTRRRSPPPPSQPRGCRGDTSPGVVAAQLALSISEPTAPALAAVKAGAAAEGKP